MPDTHDLGRLFIKPVMLSPDAPVFHRALTAEYEDPGRYSNSLVIKTPLRRKGARWGIVVGWWRDSHDDGWSALLRATQLGHEPDGDDERNFEDPTSESIRGTLIGIDQRRTGDKPDAGADG
jgi:hypothetical protein